jgi:hypothetical protein
MQMRFLQLPTVAAVILLASCSQSNTQGKLIPQDASVVIHVDGKSLSAKLPWEEIKRNPLFKDAERDNTIPAEMRMLFNNPDSSGVDSKSDFIFFAKKDTTGGYAVFEGGIKDEQRFKNFNNQFTTGGATSEKDGVTFISKPSFCLGYSKEKFVYLFDVPQMAQMDALSRRMQEDSIDIASTVKPRDLDAACKAIFAMKESNSLAKNERFGKLMKESGDIHFWVNTEEITKDALSNPMMAMVNLEKFYKGSVTTATLNFENGKITVFTKSYMGDDLQKIFKKYSGGKINDDMLKRIPGKDVVGLMALNFKPEGIKEILAMSNLDGLANLGLDKIGFTMDDFIKANKGDILFAVSDLAMKTDSVKYNFGDKDEVSLKEKPVFNYVFSASIGNKDAFNKLINAGKKLGGEMGDSSKAPFAYSSNGTYFTIANSKENADKYITGTNTNFDFIDKINDQSFGGYLNIQLLLKTFEKEAAKDSSAREVYDASLKLWDNVIMKGGDFKDDAMTQTIEVNLVDKTTNSLRQLNEYAATLGKAYKENKYKYKDKFNQNDATMPDNPSTLQETE